jgi:lipopolysaccharide heptosyltransferase I
VTRLLVVRLGSLGDLVHTLPAVAALRRAHPEAEIDWLVDGVHEEFLTLVPPISSVVTLSGRTVGAWLDVRRRLRARRYDVAADFQGLVKSAALARLSGARRVMGFDRRALREPAAAFFYGERVDVGARGHVIEKNQRLAGALGAEPGPLEFPLRAIDSEAARAVEAQVGRAYALMNPGAAWPNKRWPPDRFGRLAHWLHTHHGLRSVVLWGPGEGAAAEAVAASSNDAAVVAPETRLPDLVAIARGAGLIVSGDTGPMHIAAAVGVPTVALFGPSNPARNGPWRSDDVSLSRYESCACHYQRRCRRPGTWCLETIELEDVMRAVDRRLEGSTTARRDEAT